MLINLQDSIKLLWELKDSFYNGIIFITVLTKDNEIRTFQAHLNVHKYLKGGSAPYDFKAKNLLPIADLELTARLKHGIVLDKKGREIKTPYRAVNLNGLIGFTINGVKYEVMENEHIKPRDGEKALSKT